MMLMNKSFLKLIFIGVIVFLVQIIFNFLFPAIALNFKDSIKIHGFLFFITLIVITVTNRITDKSSDKTGFVYLGLVLFKMIASIFFLFPYFSLEIAQSKILVVNFFIIFFVYIAFEASSVIKYLNLKQNS